MTAPPVSFSSARARRAISSRSSRSKARWISSRSDGCFDHRLDVRLGDVVGPVIGLADLRRNKQASGRLQDVADLEALARDGRTG